MSVITWKNVNSRSNADAAYLMRGAQEGVKTGLDQLAGVAQGLENNRRENYETRRENNTDSIQDYFSNFATPEALAQANKDGTTAAFKESIGGNYDKDAVRNIGADTTENLLAIQDTRLGREEAVRKRSDAAIKRRNAEYTQEQTDNVRAAKPGVDQFKALLSNENYDRAEKLLTDDPEGLFATANLTSSLQEQMKTARQGTIDQTEKDRVLARTKKQDAETDRVTEQTANIQKHTNEAVVGRAGEQAADGVSILELGTNSGFESINGELDYSKSTIQELETFKAQIEQTGVLNTITDTAWLKREYKNIDEKFLLATTEEKNVAREQLTARLALEHDVSPDDLNKIMKASDALDRKYNIKKNDHYYDGDIPADQAANEAIEQELNRSTEDGDLTEFQQDYNNDQEVKEEVLNGLVQALNVGVDIMEDGVNENYRITPTHAKLILKTMHADWLENDKSVDELLQNFVRSDAFQKPYDEYTRWEEASFNLNQEAKKSFTDTPGGVDARVGRLSAALNNKKDEQRKREDAENARIKREAKEEAKITQLSAEPPYETGQLDIRSTGEKGFIETLASLISSKEKKKLTTT